MLNRHLAKPRKRKEDQRFEDKRVSKNKTRKDAMADPVHLAPLDPDDSKIIQVIIETPKGSRNKYAFEKHRRNATTELLPSSRTTTAFPTSRIFAI
jgi:hypothetical protein